MSKLLKSGNKFIGANGKLIVLESDEEHFDNIYILNNSPLIYQDKIVKSKPALPQYPFDEITWTSKSAYRLSDGVIITDNAKYRTEKVIFSTDGCYCLTAPTNWCPVLFWDNNDNYMGQYEIQYAGSKLYIYCKAGWKYAMQIYSTESVDPYQYSHSFELYDSGTSAIFPISLRLSDLQWQVSSNVLEANVADIFGTSNVQDKIKSVNHTLCICPTYSGFSGRSTAKDPLIFFFYTWSNTLLLSARYWGTNLNAALSYFQENGTTLDINF